MHRVVHKVDRNQYAMKVMEKKKLQGHLRRASGQTLAGDALKSKVLSEAPMGVETPESAWGYLAVAIMSRA